MGQCENTYSMTSSGAICAPSCEQIIKTDLNITD